MIKYGKLKVLQYPFVRYRLSEDALSNTMSDTFNKEVSSKWKKYAESERLSEKQLDEINQFIKENISPVPNRVYPVRNMENKLFDVFNRLLPEQIAFKMVFVFKNLYGYLSH